MRAIADRYVDDAAWFADPTSVTEMRRCSTAARSRPSRTGPRRGGPRRCGRIACADDVQRRVDDRTPDIV
jgi:hypothetical protein